jgi:diguanylate cyclase (GGDEF)-like protein
VEFKTWGWDGSDTAIRRRTPSVTSPAQQHVVLVDDSKSNLRTHALLLERLPSVTTHLFASSGEAIAWSNANAVDCFIVDFRMSAPDGIETTRILRGRAATQLTPIIMVTGDSDRASRYAALDAGVSDFVAKPVDPREFVARVGTFLALHDARKQLDARVDDLTASLSNEERRTRDHAARLEAICGIATNPQFGDEAILGVFLTQSASAVRPGEHFYAALFRIDGADAVLEAVGERRMRISQGSPPLGSRIPLAEMTVGIARDRGTAIAWDDVRREPSLTRLKRLQQLQVRSQLLAPMRAGGNDYVLVFNSHEPMRRPFDPDDLSYASIVAAFLQARYQQSWQSERILYQSRHDALTGLINRSRFRALMHEACTSKAGCSIAIVDLVDFSGVNLRYGNLIGDALLVEAAASLAAQARDGEFVGRLGGDTFGIGLPGATSEAALIERLNDYLAVFDEPFSTGDRDGRHFARLRARIGAAIATDGLSFNDLLSQADQVIAAGRGLMHSHVTLYNR